MIEEPLRILLLEDDPEDQRLFAIMMRKCGWHHRVGYANSLEEARVEIGQREFDVIIADLSVPDSHGKETISRIRQLGAKCPIVVLTGLEDEEAESDLLTSGAQDYLIKGQHSGRELVRAIIHAKQRQTWVNRIDDLASDLIAREMLGNLGVAAEDGQNTRNTGRGASVMSLQVAEKTLDRILLGLQEFRDNLAEESPPYNLETLLSIEALVNNLSLLPECSTGRSDKAADVAVL